VSQVHGTISRERTRNLNLFIIYIYNIYITEYIYKYKHASTILLIKTPGKHFYTETIYECTTMSMHSRNIQFKIQDINTYQKNTRCNATAERGARFHPTVGSATPNGFTTSHPRARPRGFETQSPTSRSSEVKDEGYSPSPLLKTHCIFRSSSGSPSAIPVVCSPLSPHFLSCFVLQGCVWHEFPRSGQV
jgi:hypothetical protein